MSFNKIFIVGNLGRDVDLRYTPQGKPVASFSMATTEKRGQNEQTTWFKVTFWGRQAELASQYLSKGSQVGVEGRVSLDEWTDKDGKQRSNIAVNGTELHFLGGGNRDDRSAKKSSPDLTDLEGATGTAVDEDSDVPF